MTITIPMHRLRAAGLVLLGVALGAMLVAPVVARDGRRPATDDSVVQPTAVQTRASSCHGYNFTPLRSGILYDYDGTRRTSGQPQWFVCDPQLPHRAVVTKVRFTLYDETPYGEVSDCALVRSPLAKDSAETYQAMATVPSTGSGTPGIVRYADQSIQYATIDEQKYAYWLQCYIAAAGAWYEGIHGADITYTISSANG